MERFYLLKAFKEMRLRVIGGDLRGKRLYTIPGKIIRATADRLRESIFNILTVHVKGRIVLDLFADRPDGRHDQSEKETMELHRVFLQEPFHRMGKRENGCHDPAQ